MKPQSITMTQPEFSRMLGSEACDRLGLRPGPYNIRYNITLAKAVDGIAPVESIVITVSDWVLEDD